MVVALLVKVQTLLLVSLALWGVHGEHNEEYGDPNLRNGKFLGPEFWDDLGSGLQDSVDAFERMSDKLEITFNQMIPHQFRDLRGKNGDVMIDAIGGKMGGVDDGLKIYFTGEGGAEAPSDPTISKGTEINRSIYPRPDDDHLEKKTPVGSGPGGNTRVTFNPFRNIFGNGNMFNMFRRSKPWWERDNVCIDREEIDENESNSDAVDVEDEATTEIKESDAQDDRIPFQVFGSFEVSSCSEDGGRYSCVTKVNRKGMHKTIKVMYRCCHGFVRDSVSGCTKVNLFPMSETLEGLDAASDFVSLLKSANLLDLISGSNVTIFVPTDEAIEEFTAKLEEKNEILGERNSLYRRRKRNAPNMVDFLLGHMTNGFVYAGDFNDEQILPTLNKKSPLRINIYDGYSKTMTANCARIVNANRHSLNGVIHTVDRVIQSADKTIAQIIDKDPQFTILKQLMANTDLEAEVRKDGQWTLLAPTDEAFRRLKPATLKSLLEGSSCIQTVIEHHLLPNTICSSAIQGRMKTANKVGDFLVVERSEEDKLFVDGAQIVAKDILATNGVLHIVDKVLMPEHAKPVREVLEYHNLTKFIELLEEAELMDEIEGKEGFALFAPSNAAIQNFSPSEMKALRNDKSALREVLRYHMSESVDGSGIIDRNNNMANTKANRPLRINFYSRAPLLTNFLNLERSVPMKVTAGCSRVSLMNSRACGAVVHVVEEVLSVPQSDVLEALKDQRFTLFSQMVSDVDLEEELSKEGPLTVFAPSDHALRNLPEKELQKILEDKDLMRKVIERHILREHICCSGINANNWPFMDRKRAIDGTALHIRRTPYDQLMAGPARILHCGAPTSNGIVHTVNRLVMPDRELGSLMGHGDPTGPGLRIVPIPDFTRFFV